MKKPHNIFCVVWIHRFLHTIWQDVSVPIKATEADFGYGHNVLIAVVQLMEIYGPVGRFKSTNEGERAHYGQAAGRH